MIQPVVQPFEQLVVSCKHNVIGIIQQREYESRINNIEEIMQRLVEVWHNY